jgi:Spy/CpxP family protein refolding chaperone
MKTNKIKIQIFACMIALMSLGYSANAQDKSETHNPEARAKRQTERMKADLSLTADQVAKVESINLKYAQKGKDQREQMHKQMKSLYEEKDKEMTSVLTKEQQEKYKTLRAEQKGKRMQCHKACSKKKEEKK